MIISHRGLDPGNSNFPWDENTLEAHRDLLERGFGLEFDLYPTETTIVVSHHDPKLYPPKNGTLASLEDMLSLIAKSEVPLHALHYKGKFQDATLTRRVAGLLRGFPEACQKLLIFDLLPDTARGLREALPGSGLSLAPSVAHLHDIARFGGSVQGTLMSVEAALAMGDLYDWVWLDEWDRKDVSGIKSLYTPEIFEQCREAGKKIAVISPELHATSPGLVGGESHEDAKNHEILKVRLQEILHLKPDAVCTDYPNLVKELGY